MSLTRKITTMAISSFYEGVEGPFSKEKEERWFDHWFRTAYDFQERLEKEGLTETAEAVKQIITDQKKIISHFS